MIDECRHFFGKAQIKKILEKMALLKMNRFHWHLSDDQGFRIQSDRYPLLNEIGSRRAHAILGDFMVRAKGEPYGGYYTKDDIREIEAFARERHIEIIPEIDLPGHARAILASYPHIGCRDYGTSVWSKAGISSEIICCGKPESQAFLRNLLDEMCELFGGKYFHIGGDEASYKNWKRCPDCRREMAANGLKSEKELQSRFSAALSAHLKANGKTAIIWNDCLTKDMDDDIVCQFWTLDNLEQTKDLLGERKRIYSPVTHLYLDNRYSRLPTQKVYSFRREDFGLTGGDDSVLGVEACVWTEWLNDSDMLDYVLFPRLAAVAEIGWSSAVQDTKDFMARLDEGMDYFFGDTGYCALDYYSKPPRFEKRRNLRQFWGARGFEYRENLALKQTQHKEK
jgi:hexosaminidase